MAGKLILLFVTQSTRCQLTIFDAVSIKTNKLFKIQNATTSIEMNASVKIFGITCHNVDGEHEIELETLKAVELFG